MIVRFTDPEGVTHDPIIYPDFLYSLAFPGADTKIRLSEEGDYEVALDYQIKDDKIIDRFYDYTISIYFEIRNSNTMAYTKELGTGNYLPNDSITNKGFEIDWAKSHYLDINVCYSRWTKGINGYTKDTIYNRKAKESDDYTKDGIYEITVTNSATDPYGNNPTKKRIYKGTDKVLIAYMNQKNISLGEDESTRINEIYNKVEFEGYEISEEGELIAPVITEVAVETTLASETTTETSPVTTSAAITTVSESPVTEVTAEVNASEQDILEEPSYIKAIARNGALGGTGFVVLVFLLTKIRKRR